MANPTLPQGDLVQLLRQRSPAAQTAIAIASPIGGRPGPIAGASLSGLLRGRLEVKSGIAV